MTVEQIEQRKLQFQTALQTQDTPTLVQRFVTYGSCYAIDESAYFGLKQKVASRFNLHPSQVLVVGSAKLGFSLNPDRLYGHFWDESDIDIAIIGTSLFENVCRTLIEYERRGGFWRKAHEFKRYAFEGWMRPDMLPTSSAFPFCKEWWNYFRELTRSGMYGPYPLRAGLYRDWFYLETYQMACMDNARAQRSTNADNSDE